MYLIFLHLRQMSNACLTKVIFNQMNALHHENVNMPFNYVDYIRNIFTNRGLDHLYRDLDNYPFSTFSEALSKKHQDSFLSTMEDYPSLRWYKLVKEDTKCSQCNVPPQ